MTDERELKTIASCSACGFDHTNLGAEKVEHEILHEGDKVTHVAICPVEFKVIFFLDVDTVDGQKLIQLAQP